MRRQGRRASVWDVTVFRGGHAGQGPHIVDAIRSLDGILERMREHQAKKRSLMRSLSISENL